MLYDTTSDICEALLAGKIDAYAECDAIAMMAENPSLTCLDEPISDVVTGGSVFSKTPAGKALSDEFSDYIRELYLKNKLSSVHVK